MATKKRVLTTVLRWTLITFVLLAILSIIAFLSAWRLFPFPSERLQKWPISPVVLDVKGRPLFAIVGRDEQWRYPVPLRDISPWLIQATIAVEDERFYRHGGIDAWAVLRALGQNIAARRTVSGASTLPMQLCRMMDERPRTLTAKAIESFRALQLSRQMGKEQILECYLNVAPYGGNLRGVKAASLAYFSKHAKDLALPEAALLAGLPQSPSRYRPDRNLPMALRRQKIVLRRMLEVGTITREQWKQAHRAKVELCLSARLQNATHLSWLALRRRPPGGQTTVDLDIQKHVEKLALEHVQQLPEGTEVAVVAIDVAESAIVAMLGSGDPVDPVDGQVNGALAKRSPGSALKPFLYATAFEMGRLNSESIVYDTPISRGGWTPANFDRTFSGSITTAEALRRSLNVPAILTAEKMGLARCCGVLEAVGVGLPPNAGRRGGLALAVGGVEVTLLDLTNAYATLARHGIHTEPRLFLDDSTAPTRALKPRVCASINDILSSRHPRPRGMEELLPDAVPWFMWKTGTSSGRRDAWALGHNHRYAIGVWIGRFRGTGRDAYVGAEAAEPLLSKLFERPPLRTEIDPSPPRPIQVTHPLPLPREARERLRITQPNSGDVFLCLDSKATVHASTNSPEKLTWFVNGELVGTQRNLRLTLSTGRYELLCLDPKGQAASVTFSVVP